MVGAPSLDQLQQARSGDDSAFSELIRPLIQPAYQLAVSMVQDAIEAEDVVQDACLIAWRKLGQLREATSLRSWFMAIVARRCRRARRSRWLSVIKQAEPLSGTRAIADPSATTAMELRHACRRMAHEDLLVLTLYYCLDFPLDEAAATMGVSREAAKSRLYRAIRKLRPMLDEPEEVSR